MSKSSSDRLNYTGFPGDVCVTFFNVPPGNKDAVTPNPLIEEESCVYLTVMTNAYQGQLNADFSKVCEIFKVRGIASLKYVRSGIVVTFPHTEMWRWTKRTVIGCLTCRSNGLIGGPWPINAAIYSRPSAVSLKVWLRETSVKKESHMGLEWHDGGENKWQIF